MNDAMVEDVIVGMPPCGAVIKFTKSDDGTKPKWSAVMQSDGSEWIGFGDDREEARRNVLKQVIAVTP